MTKRKIGAVCGIALLIAAIQKGLPLLPSWGGYKATGSDMIGSPDRLNATRGRLNAP